MTTIIQGKAAPDFSLPDTTGKKHTLRDVLQRGPVVLAFYKVSCPVCQYTFPFLERINQAIGHNQVALLGISQDDTDDTREFMQEYGLTFTSLVDDDGYPVSNAYGLTNVPTVLYVEQSGKAAVSFTGFDRKGLEQIAQLAAKQGGKPAFSLFQGTDCVPDHKPG